MRLLILFLIMAPLFTYSQVATEAAIPFTLNSDNDSEVNVIDVDDDNDGVLDNLDLFPLDGTASTPVILVDTVITSDDAGLRGNSNTNMNRNYGSDASVQTKNGQRTLAVKINVPPNLDLNAATLIFYADSEDDPVEVHFLPSSNWAEDTITWNTMDFGGDQLLGITGPPAGGVYTYDLPLNIMPEEGGDITLLLYDPNDPNGATEGLYTKEHIGDLPEDELGDKAPRVIFNHNQPVAPRVAVDQSAGLLEYLGQGQFNIGFKLTQAPTAPVYLPVELSSGAAMIVNDQVVVFDATNWDQFQNMQIDLIEPGMLDVYLRPLHSDDPYYNGVNPDDLFGYNVQTSDITNLSGWTVSTGSTFELVLATVNALGSTTFLYSIVEGPSGMNVKESTGEVSFTPLNYQIGTHDVTIKVVDEAGFSSFFHTTIEVTDGNVPDPIGIIVDFKAEDIVDADGSGERPFNDLGDAIHYAAINGGGDVLIRGVEYELTSTVNVTDSAAVKVTIKPMPGEHVKLNFGIRTGIFFKSTSANMCIEGIEIDGGTDAVDFWCIVGQALFGDESISRGGGLAIVAEGEYLTIKDCHIHDCYQKAVEIKGRYINVHGNIIHAIATTSLSGGHGIMRQQKGREFMDDDSLGLYRWDISENIIFNVEQRIYSWVPSKGFMEMTLDEGKPILIDDPKDTDGIQEYMSARIKNNVVAFGSIDGIRIKSTPNLEVSNNAVFSESSHADGITDKGGDTNTPQFTNFIGTNNACHTNMVTTAIEIDDCIQQTETAGGIPKIWNNVAVGGGVNPQGNAGIIPHDGNQLFVDPLNGDFNLTPTIVALFGDTLGVSQTVLAALASKAADYGVAIGWDRWFNDELLLTQTIFDNIPGFYDGVAGNETVFVEGSGEIATAVISGRDRLVLNFDVAPGVWQDTYEVPDTMQFRLNPEYGEWYHEVDSAYQTSTGENYFRIRWGSSYIKQDQVFNDDWLLHTQITADTNTVVYGPDNTFVLDGDILIDFEEHTPVDGDFFDLIIGSSITAIDAVNLFDNVIFEGYTPTEYTLQIVDTEEGQALRLTIGDLCSLLVSSKSDSGVNSLRNAITCAVDGDVIVLSSILANDTIKLTSTPLVIDKSISIVAESGTIIVQNCTSSNAIEVAANKTVSFANFSILSDQVTNFADLTCTDMTFKKKDSTGTTAFNNQDGSSLTINGEVKLE